VQLHSVRASEARDGGAKWQVLYAATITADTVTATATDTVADTVADTVTHAIAHTATGLQRCRLGLSRVQIFLHGHLHLAAEP
jgi:hypothetical protein